ncbi:MAG: HD domain-containing protein [Candidatus Colwellbacteria bacterium]
MKPSLIEKATRIATVAHKKQIRKGDGLPYIVHPFMVAMKLSEYGFPKEVIAAGLLHDVIEDTDYPEEKLRKEVGDGVVEIVLTVSKDESLKWDEMNSKYVEVVRRGSDGAKAVAAADKIHNLSSLLIAYEDQGPSLWGKFNGGKEKKEKHYREVLDALKEAWEHPILAEFEELLGKLRNLGREGPTESYKNLVTTM